MKVDIWPGCFCPDPIFIFQPWSRRLYNFAGDQGGRLFFLLCEGKRNRRSKVSMFSSIHKEDIIPAGMLPQYSGHLFTSCEIHQNPVLYLRIAAIPPNAL